MRRDQRTAREIARLRSVLGDAEGRDARPEPLTPRDEAILAKILASGTPSGRARRSMQSPWRVAVAAAAAVAVVAGVVLWQSQTPAAASTPAMLDYSSATIADVLGGAAPSARSALLELAEAAANEPVAQGQGGQRIASYAWYLNVVTNAQGESLTELVPTYQVTTMGADGSFQNEEWRGPALDATGRVRDPDGVPLGGAYSSDVLPADTEDPGYPARLPRNPADLRAHVMAEGGDACTGTSIAEATCLYFAVTNLFTRWVVPTDLAAGLWRVLADEQQLVTLGSVTDRLGRTGVAIAVPPDPERADQVLLLVIEPQTGQLLQWEQIALTVPGLDEPGPAVSAFQAVVSASWTGTP